MQRYSISLILATFIAALVGGCASAQSATLSENAAHTSKPKHAFTVAHQAPTFDAPTAIAKHMGGIADHKSLYVMERAGGWTRFLFSGSMAGEPRWIEDKYLALPDSLIALNEPWPLKYLVEYQDAEEMFVVWFQSDGQCTRPMSGELRTELMSLKSPIVHAQCASIWKHISSDSVAWFDDHSGTFDREKAFVLARSHSAKKYVYFDGRVASLTLEGWKCAPAGSPCPN